MTLTISNITKSFWVDDREISVLSGLTLTVEDGEFVCLVGPNGSGKSTLLNIIAGIVSPDSGSISLGSSLERKPMVGFAFQDYRGALLPWRTVLENLTFPLEVVGTASPARSSIARELLESFAPEILPNDRIVRLSGGQQQLISVLRTFVSRPDLVLLDEPLSALDQHRRWEIGFHIEKVWSKSRPPLVMVSHDIDEAIMLSDRILLMGPAGSGRLDVIENPHPRPRNVSTLTSASHIEMRNTILEKFNAAGGS